jgi:hypothetical protein
MLRPSYPPCLITLSRLAAHYVTVDCSGGGVKTGGGGVNGASG